MKRKISEHFHYDRSQVFDAVTRVENCPVVSGVRIESDTDSRLAPESIIQVNLDVSRLCLGLTLEVVEFVEGYRFSLQGASRLGRAALSVELDDHEMIGTLVDYSFEVRPKSRLAKMAEHALQNMNVPSSADYSSQCKENINAYLARITAPSF